MKNVIVTGANGFVGSQLILRLIREEIHVLAVDLSFADSRLPESEFIQTAEVDLADAGALAESIGQQHYDTFFHFAWRGVNGPEKASYMVQIRNVELALRCAELAGKAGCEKFLCSGTIAERAVESLPQLETVSGGMLYAAAKSACRTILETYCKSIGMKFIWMQFSNIYGPQNKTGNLICYTIEQLRRGEPATFGPAMQPYDFIYVDDLLEAVFRLGEKDVKRDYYFIGSGSPRILSEYLRQIGQMMGKEELVQIGARKDDGIRYSFEMMDTAPLVEDVGLFVSDSFEAHIKTTLETE